MKRLFDLILATVLIILLAIPMVLIAICVRLTSKGPILYWSDRIGQDIKLFRMPKFRSMLIDTPTIASHLMINIDKSITTTGRLMRRSSLDELPQLFSILKGDMSFVGPRPALFNQKDLIDLRRRKGVYKLLPGITGWAQVNGRDKLSIVNKVDLDVEYLNKQSFSFDLRILWKTLLAVMKRENISH